MAQQPNSLVTVAGKQALSATINLPEWGAWIGSFEIDADAAPKDGERVEVLIQPSREGAAVVIFTGTVMWGGAWQGRARLEVTGGAGGLSRILPARSYQQGPLPIPLATILMDLMNEAGETLATGVASALAESPYLLTRWTRVEGTVSATLTRVCQRFGLTWRVLDTGAVWVGKRTYPADPTYTAAEPTKYAVDPGDNTQLRILTLAPDAATIRPDTTVVGKRAIRVVYTLTPDAFRCEVYYPGPTGATDREDEEQYTRRLLPELPYGRLYACTVTAVRANGRVEVRADDTTVGGVDGAILLAATPETAITPRVGQRCTLFFSAADPRVAYVVGFEQDPNSTASIARVGDSIDCGSVLIVAPPGGGVCVVTAVPSSTPGSFQITGTITSGHPRIKLTPSH